MSRCRYVPPRVIPALDHRIHPSLLSQSEISLRSKEKCENIFGRGGIRTLAATKGPRDFKSLVSTNSTTHPKKILINLKQLQHYSLFLIFTSSKNATVFFQPARRFELGLRDLQDSALPLDHAAIKRTIIKEYWHRVKLNKNNDFLTLFLRKKLSFLKHHMTINKSHHGPSLKSPTIVRTPITFVVKLTICHSFFLIHIN